ncbi:hypothetical protein ACP275_08G043300 [Erythranthe tilingii]
MASCITGFVHWRVEDIGSANRASPKWGFGSGSGSHHEKNFGSSIRFSRKENFGSSIWFSCKENTVAAAAVVGGADADVSPPRRPPPPPPSPWLMLPPSIEEGTEEMFFNFYMLAEKRVVKINSNTLHSSLPWLNYVGSSHGWLAYNYSFDDQQFICNPLTRRHMYLPSIQSLPVEKKHPDDINIRMRKLILSCSPSDEEDDEDCIAMVSYDYDERLAFCRLPRGGAAGTEWTPIGKPFIELDDKTFKRNYQDFVYSSKRKLFFCVTQYAELEAWDLRDPHSPPKLIPLDFLKPGEDDENHPWGSVGKLDECELKEMFKPVKYLVICEQTDQLFLVRRYVADRKPAHYYTPVPPGFPYNTISFDVYEIDIEKGELRYMEISLNGLAMFIGINHGFAIQVGGGGGEINPDSIYFTDAKEYTPYYLNEDAKIGGHDIGVFDYAKRDFAPCYNYPIEQRTFSATLRLPRAASGADKVKRIEPPPMWFTPSTSSDT